MKHKRIEAIHESLVNGQRRQMVRQIDESELYDFWSEYSIYLESVYSECADRWNWFTDAVISYDRIKHR